MEHASAQQLWQHLDGEDHILIALPASPSTDAIASGLALASVLSKKKKHPSVVAHGFQPPETVRFLFNDDTIHPALKTSNQLVISVDITRTAVEEVSYDVRGETLKIFLSPKEGMLSPDDLTATTGNPMHTLIVVLGAPDLASLGQLFEKNTDFFYSTPIINIDHHSGNTGYGQINIVEVTAAATAEVLHDLLKTGQESAMDGTIATRLLAGIIAETKAFHSPRVTPKTLSTASALITAGARREDILRHLYQSKPIATLRLWGRVLARLQSDERGRLLWSRLRDEDFVKAGATKEAISGVLDELLHAAGSSEIVFILLEGESGATDVIAESRSTIDLEELFHGYQPETEEGKIRFSLPHMDPEEAEKEIREVILRLYHPSPS